MTLQEEKKKSLQIREELENLIEAAIRKVGASKENDLCRYLPGPKGGYMHHFTMRKLKNSNPEELFKLLQSCILRHTSPKELDPRPRAPRGSRGYRDYFSISRSEIERVLELAAEAGDDHLIAKFSPKRSLPMLKKELIKSIKAERVNPELWNAYVESIENKQEAH